MATIDSRQIIGQLIAGNGLLPGSEIDVDNPPAVKIIQYTNAWGKETWGVVFAGEMDKDRYEIETEFVQNPKVIWRKGEAEAAQTFRMLVSCIM